MKKRIITLALGAGAMAVAGLGIMSPVAHATSGCGPTSSSLAGNATPAGSPVYAGGSPLSYGYVGVSGLSPAGSGYAEAEGTATSGSGQVRAYGTSPAGSGGVATNGTLAPTQC